MNYLKVHHVKLNDINLVTKEPKHLPSNASLRRVKAIYPNPNNKQYLYRYNDELYYADNFYEIALLKKHGTSRYVLAEIQDAYSLDEIIYNTLCNSYREKVGIQKVKQFQFELVQMFSDPDVIEIENNTGIPQKLIKEFSFHPKMTKEGRNHAMKSRDLAMMNKIWSSTILTKKAPFILKYLESSRIKNTLTAHQFHFIEKYARTISKPFQRKRKYYIKQIDYLLNQKEIRVFLKPKLGLSL